MTVLDELREAYERIRGEVSRGGPTTAGPFTVEDVGLLFDRIAELEAENAQLREVYEAAGVALSADAVAEWQDEEGDGLRSVYRRVHKALEGES